MEKEGLKEAIYAKAYAKLSILMLKREEELVQEPYLGLTQEMIDNSIRFIDQEIEIWNDIMRMNELDR